MKGWCVRPKSSWQNMISREIYLGLDDRHVVPLDAGGPHRGTPGAVRALRELARAARADGISLDVASSYRSFERQAQIFEEKYSGLRPVLDGNERPLNILVLDPRERVEAITRFSAIPGLSRHHFGTDFDIYSRSLLPPGGKLELTRREYDPDQYFYPLGQWLERHLEDYGFVRPYTGEGRVAYEPWHISFKSEAEQFIRAYDIREELKLLESLNRSWSAPAREAAERGFRDFLA